MTLHAHPDMEDVWLHVAASQNTHPSRHLRSWQTQLCLRRALSFYHSGGG